MISYNHNLSVYHSLYAIKKMKHAYLHVETTRKYRLRRCMLPKHSFDILKLFSGQECKGANGRTDRRTDKAAILKYIIGHISD
jgi:hypothetical protein